MPDGLEFYNACWCAGTGCGGHLQIKQAFINWTPIGYQGAAQHTYTQACAGHHAPGPCPLPVAISSVTAGVTGF